MPQFQRCCHPPNIVTATSNNAIPSFTNRSHFRLRNSAWPHAQFFFHCCSAVEGTHVLDDAKERTKYQKEARQAHMSNAAAKPKPKGQPRPTKENKTGGYGVEYESKYLKEDIRLWNQYFCHLSAAQIDNFVPQGKAFTLRHAFRNTRGEVAAKGGKQNLTGRGQNICHFV